MPGPLTGARVIELAGLGPAPFCGMVLADLGAEVIKIDRPGSPFQWLFGSAGHNLHSRGKKSICVDLKQAGGVAVMLDLVSDADALIEGFRPGVAERLGVGPADCLARNRSLVFGRVTGWGQTGPYADMAGHDIDYIALSGVLGSIGPSEHPVPPLNLVGDFGGGGMLLALGVVSALFHVFREGEGQVVDAAMVDGSALLSTSHHGFMADGWWQPSRDSNLLDGAAPFYTTYETSDGGHVAVGALEPRFFAELLDRLDLDPAETPSQMDRDRWPRLREVLADRFATRTRDEWAAHFEGTDSCVVPVLAMDEAPRHPHNVARDTFLELGGVTQPAPAPRFSRTPAATPDQAHRIGEDTDAILSGLGYSNDRIGKLRDAGAIA